jgi:leucine dehydrogenase
MSVYEAEDFDGHEQVTFFYDKKTGLKAIIAIHNTNLGPALGGCRMWPYKTEQDAVSDVLRLSKGMTYKAAMANLPLGGGKAVIIGDPHHEKSPELFRAFGQCVEKINGRYITCEDVQTSIQDMVYVRETTFHVVGLPGGSGDPSPFTAVGVADCIREAVEYRLKKSSLEGVRVAIQGLGHVGYQLCRLLSEEGAHLIVTDIDPRLVDRVKEEFKAEAVLPNDIYSVDADVFAPCALGAVLNDHTIPQLKCSLIVGSANNQLATDEHGEILMRMNILYAPDYVVNGGGLIDVYYDGPNYNEETVKAHVAKIRHTLREIFKKAEEHQVSTSHAADMIAENRFKNLYMRSESSL